MVGVTMVEVVVLHPTVVAVEVVLQVPEHQLVQETMVVEVCYSLQHLELHL